MVHGNVSGPTSTETQGRHRIAVQAAEALDIEPEPGASPSGGSTHSSETARRAICGETVNGDVCSTCDRKVAATDDRRNPYAFRCIGCGEVDPRNRLSEVWHG